MGTWDQTLEPGKHGQSKLATSNQDCLPKNAKPSGQKSTCRLGLERGSWRTEKGKWTPRPEAKHWKRKTKTTDCTPEYWNTKILDSKNARILGIQRPWMQYQNPTRIPRFKIPEWPNPKKLKICRMLNLWIPGISKLSTLRFQVQNPESVYASDNQDTRIHRIICDVSIPAWP